MGSVAVTVWLNLPSKGKWYGLTFLLSKVRYTERGQYGFEDLLSIGSMVEDLLSMGSMVRSEHGQYG